VGALILGPSQPAVLVAGGAGEATSNAVRGALGGAVTAMGQTAKVEDVRPLPESDPHGVVPFFLVLGVSISALIYQILASFMVERASLGARVGAMVGFAVLDGLIAGVAVGLVLGFDASFWPLAVVCGALAFAIVAATAALQAAFGRPGIGISALFVVILGAATSGSIVGPDFLPDAFRSLSPVLPSGAALSAVRGALYFDAAGLASPLLVLSGWVVVSVAIVAGLGAWRTHRTSARQARLAAA